MAVAGTQLFEAESTAVASVVVWLFGLALQQLATEEEGGAQHTTMGGIGVYQQQIK